MFRPRYQAIFLAYLQAMGMDTHVQTYKEADMGVRGTSDKRINMLDDQEIYQMLSLGTSYLNPNDLPSILASPIALAETTSMPDLNASLRAN